MFLTEWQAQLPRRTSEHTHVTVYLPQFAGHIISISFPSPTPDCRMKVDIFHDAQPWLYIRTSRGTSKISSTQRVPNQLYQPLSRIDLLVHGRASCRFFCAKILWRHCFTLLRFISSLSYMASWAGSFQLVALNSSLISEIVTSLY